MQKRPHTPAIRNWLALTVDSFTTAGGLAERIGNISYLRGEGLDQRVLGKAVDRALASNIGILFSNPYRTEEFRAIYRELRAAGAPLLVVERGGLPDTIMIDPSGFLADSRFFDRCYWECIDDAKASVICDDLSRRVNSGPLLEAQGSQPAAHRPLLTDLTADPRPKVLVILQLRGDTAVRFFTAGHSYDEFLQQVELLADERDLLVLTKRHPLSDPGPVPGIDVSDIHLNDLLAVSDCVTTFSSGTALHAMLAGVPIAFAGLPFWGHPALASPYRGPEDLRRLIAEGINEHATVDRRRFLSYLWGHYYYRARLRTVEIGGLRRLAYVDLDSPPRPTIGRDMWMLSCAIRRYLSNRVVSMTR